ncbi:MAG: S-layer homology domain-containing protein [Clostridia bacterium]|nr:S-layer homology domain-containing protein [Clostridia bacterium]
MSLKRVICALICVLMIASALPLFASAEKFDHSSLCTANEWDMLNMINQKRLDAGKLPLSILPSLQMASGTRAEEVGRSGKVEHYRPNGDAWHLVLKDVNFKYDSNAVEEICGIATADAKPIFDAWSNSERHLKIMTNDLYVHLGVGYSGTDGRHSWVNVFSGCTITSAQLYNEGDVAHMTAGGSIDDMGLILVLGCEHGSSYLPVTKEMVSNYDPHKPGYQTITVNYGSIKTDAKIYNDFVDVKQGSWYYDAVRDAVSCGLFGGVSGTEFAPKTTMTRAMFVTVLGKLGAIDASLYTETPFSDVKAGKWYAPYVAWAARSAIVAGTGGGTFSPSQSINRQEICLMLYRFTLLEEKNFKDNPQIASFKDVNLISSWAKEAVEFCRMKGFISGNDLGCFEPKANATRAQCATIVVAYKNAKTEN